MNILCCLGSHKYYLIREFRKEVRQIGCERCPGVWGMNDSVKALLKWDKELNNLHYGSGSQLIEEKILKPL